MALPTAQTPGYTTYSGKVSCVCLAAWLPWLERLCLAHGYIRYRLDVLQLTGNYSLSGGTHAGGGVYDIKQYDTRIVALAREMGAPATWMRNMLYADGSPGNTHTHGVLSGCPHNSQARYQITAQARGYNGMGKGTVSPYIGVWGYGGKDPHPDPKVYRTWSQGITWAKAEIARVTGQNLIDNLETIMALSDADKVWLTALVEKRPWFYKNPDTTRDAYDYLRNPGLDVWDENFVTRDGEQVSMKQEIADIKTQAIATTGALAALSAKVDTLKDGVANLVTLIQESHPKADPDPAPADPVPAFGFDVSRHQTTDEVKAALQGVPDFCIINASTGLLSSSSALAANEGVSRSWADVTGFYHWGQTVNSNATTPDKSDPVGEAKHYLETIAPYLHVGDLLALDNEENLGTWEQRVAYDIAWLESTADAREAVPLNYKNWSWIKGIREAATVEQWERWCKFPIWLAQPVKNLTDKGTSGTYGVDWRWREPGEFDTVSPKPGSTISPRILVHQYSIEGGIDHNWTPDLAALRACGVKKL